MARVPTDVVRLSELAGKGPPCIIAGLTSTPVGQLFIRMRPAFLSRMRMRCRAPSESAASQCSVAVSCPSRLSATDLISRSSSQRTINEEAPKFSSAKLGLDASVFASVKKMAGLPQ